MSSLKDIASELDVSPSLVSKVLNNRLGTTGAGRDTIIAIRRKAAQLGYRKNISAAALRAGRQQTLGVFLHRCGRSGTGLIEAFLEGVSEQAKKVQYRLILHFFETADEFRALQEQLLHYNAVDGLIVAGVGHPDLGEDVRQLQECGVNTITIQDVALDPTVPNIGIDQREVGRLATAHLVERGCRRIAHLRQTDARYEGYCRALQEARIAYDPKLVYDVGSSFDTFSAEGAMRAVDHWRATGVIYDGLFAPSDEQAVAAMNMLVSAGIRIPEQVKVVGVDDAAYGQFAIVPLTSVCQRYRDRGREAVSRLLSDRDEQAPQAGAVSFAPQLRVRQSTA